ncbi:D-alanine--D-alanine ligase [Leptospira sp. 2 VSF19]|uniref:D-alanine--D-alanine ligase n=1 Tax=Leptospira soteropolitanensis TaxID=2950025 RepID=A0AAW5VKI0_9LEPT|nr:D-alanine--D-alanine ligase [Leptospira soteropolitanensis]MCW7492091.1 D-alanine--D-alanine ligase [Leptospira soteropolitanensis]MCW7499673.1 D-alanine--D-alanine ligase [Leptospira soteropolitanensis]MCW7521924.1 D-alanine--D-alanine ligase [Leptospira soteropolitanensis]MCW7525778.1 D-alanine--D-alanine ligase [Leptospira soteropolitanensis]MCW7530108.1 D-alanine--D-alanine ligase [Leptospira soteropolitanensis]
MKGTVILACDVYDANTPEFSQEWESEESIQKMEQTILDLGYDVAVLSNPTEITSVLSNIPLDERRNWIVWNLVEGYQSPNREAYIPALCEYLAVPHTGSSAAVQTLTLDKYKTKLFLRSFGIPTADSWLVEDKNETPQGNFPLFVKPNGEGSSLGINEKNLIQNIAEWRNVLPALVEKFHSVIAESYLSGRELTIAVFGNKGEYTTTAPAFVDYPGSVYSDLVKSKENFVESLDFTVPKDLSESLITYALKIASLLGSSGYIRIDFKLEKDLPYLLEVNATPGFSSVYSTLPLLWEKSGKTYSELLSYVLDLGFQEYKHHHRYQYAKDKNL